MRSIKIVCLVGFIIGCLPHSVVTLGAEKTLPEAEVVWVASEAGNKTKRVYSILYSSLHDGVWSAGKKIYSSKFPLTTPSVYSSNNSNKVVVWSELQTSRTVINYLVKTEDSWGEMHLLSDIGIENLGPSVIEDTQGQLWAFWSAHQNDNDDIYQSVFNGSSWSVAKRAHAKNSVPDYGASTSLNKNGNIVLRWKSFSAILNGYQTSEKVISTTNQPTKIDAQESNDAWVLDKSISDIVAPNFLPTNALHIVHIPGNFLNKNFRVNDR